MIHIRLDDGSGGESPNSEAKFACGLTWPLPEGDKYFFEAEVGSHWRVDCLGCNPVGQRQLGTPLSELSGQPGDPRDLGDPRHAGYENFKRIARSWGYD